MPQRKSIDVYLKPAGGWDALKSSWHALREQQVVMKGAGTLLHAVGIETTTVPSVSAVPEPSLQV